MTGNMTPNLENQTTDDAICDRAMFDESIFMQKFRKKELLFKIVVIGDYGVGKTSIIKRFADGTFSSSYKITIGADFALKSLEWNENTKINLQLWDIAGHERFGTLTGVYYRYAAAAAIVFDLTRPETFNSVEKWLLDLRRKVSMPGGHSVPVVILANKGDITIETLPPQIVQFCARYNILAWFITSAKDNVHIDEAMLTLVNAAMQNNDSFPIYSGNSDIDIVKLNNESEANARTCCQR